MGPEESKSYQLRVRITSEERDLLEKLRTERDRGETISDLVREAIGNLAHGISGGSTPVLPTNIQQQVNHLAVLLKREPRQVEEACVEGILDLIESKCDVPLIVMETHLHLKYRGHDGKLEFPWKESAPETPAPDAVNPADESS